MTTLFCTKPRAQEPLANGQMNRHRPLKDASRTRCSDSRARRGMVCARQ